MSTTGTHWGPGGGRCTRAWFNLWIINLQCIKTMKFVAFYLKTSKFNIVYISERSLLDKRASELILFLEKFHPKISLFSHAPMLIVRFLYCFVFKAVFLNRWAAAHWWTSEPTFSHFALDHNCIHKLHKLYNMSSLIATKA